MGTDEQPTDVGDPVLIASGKRLGGRYRLDRPLGHGGMAAVWLATDERLGREVAVKVLSDTLVSDQQYLARFRREAHTAASLQHPNLVPVYDYDAGERPYLVMEYVAGGDLAECSEAGRAPDPHRLAIELLSALRHIHGAGVLHRDIKPHNVLIDADGSARLTDFGIAQPAGATSLTRTGHLIGTESYLAPELKEGAPPSERSDLYALGVVLGDVARDGAGASLWELIDRLRDDEPGQRPKSAAAALAALQRGARRPLPGTATKTYEITDEAAAAPPSPPVSASRPFEPSPAPRRRGALLGWLALGAIAVALVAGLLLLGGGDDPNKGSSAPSAAANGDKPADQPRANAPDTASAEEPAATDTPPAETTPAEPVSTDGSTLNDQGKALNDQGAYADAVPVLEQAVDSLGASGDETTYNYALYNLGVAYLNSGDPKGAIKVLKERMKFDDGQLSTVQATLDDAYAAAGRKPKP